MLSSLLYCKGFCPGHWANTMAFIGEIARHYSCVQFLSCLPSVGGVPTRFPLFPQINIIRHEPKAPFSAQKKKKNPRWNFPLSADQPSVQICQQIKFLSSTRPAAAGTWEKCSSSTQTAREQRHTGGITITQGAGPSLLLLIHKFISCVCPLCEPLY